MNLLDIYYGYVPFKDEVGGKDRPAIILQIDNNLKELKCLKITGAEHSSNYTNYYNIDNWSDCGLSKPSIVCLDEYYTIVPRRFIGKLAYQDLVSLYSKFTSSDIKESLNESTANSNGVYSLFNGWLKEPVRDAIPDELDLEPELSEWLKRSNECQTIEDIDNFMDDIYKVRQESILSEGEYGRGNQIFKELRNRGILNDLKEKKVELENKEMSLESLDEALQPVQRGSTIIETKRFTKEFRKLGLDDDDLLDLEESIMTYPPEASLGSNVYKFRWSPKKWGQGQSNGARLIYIYLLQNKKVYLMKIYKHNQQDNLSDKELESFRKSAKLF